MTLREYIQVNKNVTFNEMPFNEVDNLLLSELSYIDFELFMPFKENKKISLKMLATLFFNRFFYPSSLANTIVLILLLASVQVDNVISAFPPVSL